MVLTGGTTAASHISAAVYISTVGGLCLILGYISNWLSPFARKHRGRVRKLDDMLDDWTGAPSRPGFDEIPSIPARLKSIEDRDERREVTQAVIEHNLADLNRSLGAAHKRLDEFGKTFEQERGDKSARLRQIQHDATQTRMIINYINLDRERKEHAWAEELRKQGLKTPEPTGPGPARITLDPHQEGPALDE